MMTGFSRHRWKHLHHDPAVIAKAIAGDGRRVLFFGVPGIGKSTLCGQVAVELIAAGHSCQCLGADPGTPSFGLPGAVSLGYPSDGDWMLQAWEALCTLDAGRFRLPLVEAVSSLSRQQQSDILLLDSPGVTRGVAGSELLRGLVTSVGIDLVIAVHAAQRMPPLAQELAALGVEVLLVPAAAAAKRPGKRARARNRTSRWNSYLSQAHTDVLDMRELAILGTPPPREERGAWAGRQVALLAGGKTTTLAEVLDLEQERLKILAPVERIRADALLVRDAARDDNGLLQTVEPFVSERIDYVPWSPIQGVTDGGPRITGRMGNVDFHLVNGVFGDPLLHLSFRHIARSLLFDLGDGSRLSARIAHRISDVFVSHAHMDHIGGFQWLLRSRLGEFPPCRIHGPPGTVERIDHFMKAFLWDRIGDKGAVFEVRELEGDRAKRVRLQAGRAEPEVLEERQIAQGVLLEEPGFRVRAVQLNHHTPVLAFSLELTQTLNIRRDRLRATGMEPGPWLTELKQRLLAGNGDALIALPDGQQRRAGELGRELVLIQPGKKLVYATDLVDNPENRRKLVTLARNAHTFVCEAPFCEEEAEHAARVGHLTARAAGEIASEARVSRLVPFHFSRRHSTDPQLLYEELKAACAQVVIPPSPERFHSETWQVDT